MTAAGTITFSGLRGGGKRALAEALALAERRPHDPATVALLDEAFSQPRAHVVGLTGPPGVGKSTLTNAVIARWRTSGLSVGVIAVDPSSKVTGGALLGDRTRIVTDPEDDGVFVRSMAARDRLGGLSELTLAAVALMRALFDRVLVETVGIGQSESDIALVADTIVLCVQPASGDALQFMKSGIMELPDLIAVTKADMEAPARRALADVEGALSLGAARPDGWVPPVVAVSAQTGEGLEALDDALANHWRWLGGQGRLGARRAAQADDWVADAVKHRFGRFGLERLAAMGGTTGTPFARSAAALDALDAAAGRSSLSGHKNSPHG